MERIVADSSKLNGTARNLVTTREEFGGRIGNSQGYLLSIEMGER
jgi:hypothetical protein